jgi:hypothetical protein
MFEINSKIKSKNKFNFNKTTDMKNAINWFEIQWKI